MLRSCGAKRVGEKGHKAGVTRGPRAVPCWRSTSGKPTPQPVPNLSNGRLRHRNVRWAAQQDLVYLCSPSTSANSSFQLQKHSPWQTPSSSHLKPSEVKKMQRKKNAFCCFQWLERRGRNQAAVGRYRPGCSFSAVRTGIKQGGVRRHGEKVQARGEA